MSEARVEERAAEPDEIEGLGLQTDTPVTVVTRVIMADGERVALREAYALLHTSRDGGSEFSPELRLVLADREIPQETLAGSAPLPVFELARTGRVRGLLIRLDPEDSSILRLTPLLPPGSAAAATPDRPATGASGRILRNLRRSTQRVSGDLECPPAADLQCTVHFSAPLFTEY
jgi:hypothetical protein